MRLSRANHTTVNSFTGTMRPLRPKLLPFAVSVTLIVMTSYLPLLVLWGQYKGGMFRYLVFAHSWVFSSWLNPTFLVTLAVIAIARWWEKVPWSSIGISRPLRADPFLGVVAFLVYGDYLYIRSSILRYWIATNFSTLHTPNLTLSLAVYLLVTTALFVLFEELATRAYIIERVIKFTGNRLFAGLASVLVSLAIHVPGRTLGDILRIAPITLLLTALYIWRRNIVPTFIAHFAGNAVGMLILNSPRHWVLWLAIPSRNWIVVLPVAASYLALHYLFEQPSRLHSD
jgi:membrane protease YdiL (CAAX protease family)